MANINVSLESGIVSLSIDTAKNTVDINNADPSRDALFNVFNAAVLNGQPISSVIVWSYVQPPASSVVGMAIPTRDNSGNTITWQVGNITNPKTGQIAQGITSPPWQLTMV
jgi:hypothetical protein